MTNLLLLLHTLQKQSDDENWLTTAYLREVLEKEGRPVKKLICAGDFENDISMIKAADMGYAVANATPDCKEAADRVTVSCDENAIAVIIRELEEEME